MAFIPTAADFYPTRPWMDEDRAKLVSLGFQITDYDIKGKDLTTLRSDLAQYQVIFVSGGNTFYLLDHVRRSEFDRAVHELLAKDVIYVGSSAGSIIMGADIEFAKSLDMPVPELSDFHGLDLIHTLIIPHYGREKYRERHEKLLTLLATKTPLYSITLLRDDQAIMVNGGTIEIVTSCGDRYAKNSKTK